MATSVGDLAINVSTNTATVESAFNKLASTIDGTFGKIASAIADVQKGGAELGETFLKLGGILAGAIGVGSFVKLIEGAIAGQAELARLAERTGATVESLSAMTTAAKYAGVGMDDVAKGLQKFAVSIVEAQKGTGKQADALTALGFNAKTFATSFKTTDEAVLAVAQRLNQYSDGIGKTAIQQNLLGKSGANLAVFLREVAERGLDNVKVTTEQARAAKELEDSIIKLRSSFTALVNSIATTLVPVLQKVVDNIGTFKEIAIGAIAAFVVWPATLALVASAVTAYKEAAIGAALATEVLGIQASLTSKLLGGIVLPAELAAGGLVALRAAGLLVFAAFTGWQIGKFLSDNFVEARIAGIAFVDSMLTAWENIKYAGLVAWEVLKLAFFGMINAIRDALSGFYGVIAKGLSTIGLEGLAASFSAVSTSVKSTGSAITEFDANIARLGDENAKAKAKIHAITDDMALVAVLARDGAVANAKAAQSPPPVPKEAAKALRDTAKAIDEYLKALTGLSKAYGEAIAKQQVNAIQNAEADLQRAYSRGLVDFRQYYDQKTALQSAALQIEARQIKEEIDLQTQLVAQLQAVADKTRTNPLADPAKQVIAETNANKELIVANTQLLTLRGNLAVVVQKQAQVGKDYIEVLIAESNGVLKSNLALEREIDARELANESIGKTATEVIDLSIARVQEKLANTNLLEQTPELLDFYDKQIDRLGKLRAATAKGEGIQQQFDDLRALFSTLDSTARDIFNSIGEKGADMWTKIKESGKKILLDFLYSLTLKPFLITIAASLTGVAGNAAANVLGGGGQGNPLSYLLGGANALNVPGFAGGSIQYPAGGGLSGLNNIPTLIGLPSFSTAVGNLGTIIPTFTASMESGAGVIASASAAFAGTAASFATVALPVVGILGLLATSGIFGKSHGPKTQGEFAGTFDQSGALTSTLDSAITGITGDNQSASDARQFAQGLATTFFQTLRQLGGTSGALQFGVGFSTDPNGDAKSHVSTVLRNSSGTAILAQNNQNVERDDASLKAEIALQAQRAVLAALQSSDLPQDIAKILNSVDVATASSDTITKIEAAATVVASFSDSISGLGPQIAALNGDQLVAFVDALGGAQKAVDTFTFINANFTTSAAKAANVQAALVKGFDDLGIAVPKTHDEFLALLGSFDLTTDSGRSLYASVSQLAPLFVQVAGTADQVAEALKKSAAAGRDFYASKFLTPTEQLANRQTIDSTQIYEATKAGTLLNNVLHTLGFETVPTTVESVRSLVTATIAKYGADSKEADALFAIIPIIGDLIDSVGGFGDAATQAADKVSEAASVIITSVGDIIHQATDLAQTQLSSFSNLAGESTGDFGSKLSIQIDLINAAIKNANRADFTSSTAFNTYINTLKASSANLSSELANFTVLSAQYDASRAEQLINLQQWYNEQLKIFGGDKIAAQIASLESLRSQYTRFADAGSATAIAKIADIDKQVATLQASGGPALDALKTIYDQKWAAIVNGASAAAQSLDDFIKSIQQIASNTGGNAGQQARLEQALSSAKLADLTSKYAAALPGSALAKSIQADITKLGAYSAGLATQLAHFTTYSAQYGTDVANQLVNLEVEFAGWKDSVAGNADALAIVTEIFNDKFKAIVDGVKDGVDQLSKLKVDIADYLKGLVIGDLSPLTPRQKLDQSQTAYVEELSRAQKGDVTALGEITRFADAYLKEARDFYASSQPYTDIFTAVTQAIGSLAGTTSAGQPLVASPDAAQITGAVEAASTGIATATTVSAANIVAAVTDSGSQIVAALGNQSTPVAENLSNSATTTTSITNAPTTNLVSTSVDNSISTVASAITSAIDNSTSIHNVSGAVTDLSRSTSTLTTAVDNSTSVQNVANTEISNLTTAVTNLDHSVSTSKIESVTNAPVANVANATTTYSTTSSAISAVTDLSQSTTDLSSAIDNSTRVESVDNSAVENLTSVINNIDHSITSSISNVANNSDPQSLVATPVEIFANVEAALSRLSASATNAALSLDAIIERDGVVAQAPNPSASAAIATEHPPTQSDVHASTQATRDLESTLVAMYTAQHAQETQLTEEQTAILNRILAAYGRQPIAAK